jgi:hypothetical protein
MPPRVGGGRLGSGCSADEAAHVITLWYMDSEYLGAHSRPVPLRLHGPAPSIEALIKRVNPRLSIAGVLDYLNAAKTLKKEGRRRSAVNDFSSQDCQLHLGCQKLFSRRI